MIDQVEGRPSWKNHLYIIQYSVMIINQVEGRRKAGVWHGITRELWPVEEGGGLRRFLMMRSFTFLFYTFTFRFGRHHLGNQWGWWWEGGDQKGGWHGGRGGSLEGIL